MSAQPTIPQTIQQTPITHQRVTRNNKPAIITLDEDTNLALPRRSSWIHARMPNIISQETLNSLMSLSERYRSQFTPRKLQRTSHIMFEPECNAVVHPVTGETITKYKKLIVDDVTRPVWEESMCKELGRLAQGYDKTKGTNTVYFMKKEDIKHIPKDRTITYARIVVDYRPQKTIQTGYASPQEET